MKKVSFLIAALTFTLFSNAQESKQQNSLLWKIEGNGLSKPSYLFGTIHMLCAPDFEIKEKVTNAFNSTTNLVMELNYADPNEMAAMQKMMQSETTLSGQMTDAEKKSTDELLTSSLGISLAQADHITPAGLFSVAVVAAFSCPPAEMKLYELEFCGKAKAQNKKISGLETIDQQSAAMSQSYSLKDVLAQIQQKEEYSKVITKMTALYKEENLPELYELINDKRFMSDSAKNILITQRNREWVKKIPAIIKQESTFFAVGAAHLYGNDGVIALLKKKGYSVTPVK